MVIRRLDIAARFPLGDLTFQAKESAARERFVSTFGNGVNLDIGDHQVLGVELMRRGFRKRGSSGSSVAALPAPGRREFTLNAVGADLTPGSSRSY